MNNKILITGGAGFLGSHLCDRLLSQGYDVLCVDNFQTGRTENVSHLLENQNFKTLYHDVCEPLEGKVDRIFNLACPASPPSYQSDPIGTTKTAVLGAINLLGLAEQCGARIMQASTSEVYGDPKVRPQHEEYWGNVNPIGPRACYDEGKRCAETLFFDYHRQLNVDIRVIRIFNTYGPRMDPKDGRVISNFITQALNGDAITLYGDGLQTRSFCYVDDMIDGMTLMMDQDQATGPVNLGNPVEITIRELAEHVLQLTNSKSKIEFRPLPQDDPHHRQPDITRAKCILGWKPKVSLDDGLKETVAHFKKVLE